MIGAITGDIRLGALENRMLSKWARHIVLVKVLSSSLRRALLV